MQTSNLMIEVLSLVVNMFLIFYEVLGSFFVIQVTMKGVVLVNVSLSREVVPSFARILLHTSLGKKHLVRPLLRTEITQVINRRSWYDATKLTQEVLSLYKVCIYLKLHDNLNWNCSLSLL
jgi:hypothetical protein